MPMLRWDLSVANSFSLHCKTVLISGACHGPTSLLYTNSGMYSNTIILMLDYPKHFIFYLEKKGRRWQMALQCPTGFLKAMQCSMKPTQVNRVAEDCLIFLKITAHF